MNFIIISVLTMYQVSPVQMTLVEFNDRIQGIQESSAQCTIKMARQHFYPGSILCIIQSGLPRKTNLNTAKTTYRLMLDKFMNEERWTILIKQANCIKDEVILSFCLTPYSKVSYFLTQI